MIHMNRFPSALAGTLISVLFHGAACAQYPAKPIRLIVGFPPGGSADNVTRILGQGLSQALGQPVVVENPPGADSAIGAEAVMRAVPDGYTLYFGTSSAMTGAVALRKVAPYDPVADFTAISMVGRSTAFLYMHPSLPAKTLAELIGYARANPGKLNYGAGNPGALMQTTQLMNLTGINLVHVPYKGEGPIIPDLIAGRVHLSFSTAASALSHVKDGRLRALAVLLDERTPRLRRKCPPSPKLACRA